MSYLSKVTSEQRHMDDYCHINWPYYADLQQSCNKFLSSNNMKPASSVENEKKPVNSCGFILNVSTDEQYTPFLRLQPRRSYSVPVHLDHNAVEMVVPPSSISMTSEEVQNIIPFVGKFNLLSFKIVFCWLAYRWDNNNYDILVLIFQSILHWICKY